MIKKISEGVRYQKLTEEEKKARGILGRLVGVCADFINPTRNGRGYSEQLWENVFNSDIMKEKIANKVCYGELGHPEDRTEIDMEKVAVCLAEQPVKNSKGQLEAVFDILDTPNGRILKTLCDYGSTVGISSRGQGDLTHDSEGNEIVDPDTYECECWDVVLTPAVKAARLQYVTEGLDSNKVKLRQALTEAFSKESEEGKKIMEETLKNLNINLNEAVEKEIKLSDCTEVTSFEQACEIVDKLHAKWIFGYNDGGFGNGKVYYDAYTKNGNKIYIYEKGADSVAFLMNPSKEIVNNTICDINDKAVNTTILVDLNPKQNEDTKEEVTESVIVEKKKDDDDKAPVFDFEADDETKADDNLDNLLSDETENAETDENDEAKLNDKEGTEENPSDLLDGVSAEETEDSEAEEDERSDEEIFLDYLVDNFEEKQIKKACKALGIDIPDLEDEESDDADDAEEDEADEEQAEDENSTEAEEATDEDKESDEDKTMEANDEVDEALDKGSTTLIKSLQEALKGRSDLEALVKTLQEQLAVSDAKANELTEECNKYKQAVTRLSTLAKSKKDLEDNVSRLEESLKAKEDTINEQTLRISRLVKSRKESMNESVSLNESVTAKSNELKSLKESYESQIKDLTNKLEVANNTSSSEIKTLNENLTNANKLKEGYKKLANDAMNILIEEKAKQLGLTSIDIKRKLGATYTINDVQTVCEELKRYQLGVAKLPFAVGSNLGVRVNESVTKAPIRQNTIVNDDDDVDAGLMRLANI